MATVTVEWDDPEPPYDVTLVDRVGGFWYYDSTVIEVNGCVTDHETGWRFNDTMSPMSWNEMQMWYIHDFPMTYGDVVHYEPQEASNSNRPDISLSTPQSGFIVKDSGAREEYANGFVRDSEENKHDFTRLLSIEGLEFVPVELVERIAAHMSKGAVKYGKENWRQARGAVAKARFLRSACRHFLQWVRGDRDEDHGMAVCFNIIAHELTEENDA